jgi:hypothetical protein
LPPETAVALLDVMPERRRLALLAASNIAANELEVHSVSVGLEMGAEFDEARTKGYIGLRSLEQAELVEKRERKSSCGWFDTYKLTPLGWWLTQRLVDEMDARKVRPQS